MYFAFTRAHFISRYIIVFLSTLQLLCQITRAIKNNNSCTQQKNDNISQWLFLPWHNFTTNWSQRPPGTLEIRVFNVITAAAESTSDKFLVWISLPKFWVCVVFKAERRRASAAPFYPCCIYIRKRISSSTHFKWNEKKRPGGSGALKTFVGDQSTHLQICCLALWKERAAFRFHIYTNFYARHSWCSRLERAACERL